MRTAINGIKKERIGITIDSQILEKIKVKAEQDDRSLSQYINHVLRQTVMDIKG